MEHITTGVDRFSRLLASHKKLTVSEAAKELGVAQSTIEDWAELLEKEGRVVTHYGFKEKYLEYLQKGSEQAPRKQAEKKDSLIRKIEQVQAKLRQESSTMKTLRQDIEQAASTINVNKIRSEVEEVEEYQKRSEDIEKDVAKTTELMKQRLKDVKELLKEQSKQYEETIHEVSQSADDIKEQEEKIESLKQKESTIDEKREELVEQEKVIEIKLKTLERREDKVNELIERLREAKKAFKDAHKELEEQEQNIDKEEEKTRNLLDKRENQLEQEEMAWVQMRKKQERVIAEKIANLHAMQQLTKQLAGPLHTSTQQILQQVIAAQQKLQTGDRQSAQQIYEDIRSTYDQLPISPEEKTVLYYALMGIYHQLIAEA